LALGDKLGRMTYYLRHIAGAALLLAAARPADAQPFDSVGTRAAGMAGAFVAVADDASAAYWNPAGFAAGNFFTIVVDRSTVGSDPAVPEGAARRTGFLFAMGMPALGLSYYQVRETGVTAGVVTAGLKPGPARADAADEVRLATLVTHHTGATLVQSIAPGLAVGATLKLVRGIASSNVVADGDRDTLLSGAGELGGKGTTTFDSDVGLMWAGPLAKAGVVVRNLRARRFVTPAGTELTLARQARAGVALVPIEGWVVDLDLDLTRRSGPLGDVRDLAAGTEGRLGRRAFVRGGFRMNTSGSDARSLAAGGSYMISGGVVVDAHVTRGSARGDRGWGISARFVY
jgi:hypothetical protein